MAPSPIDSDEQSLQKFLQSTLPTSSPSPYNFSAPVCSWYGVRCSVTQAQRRISGLFLEGLSLHGNIPDQTLGKLSELTQLSLYNNSLNGSIAQDLWTLGNLQYLSLSMNGFTNPSDLHFVSLAKLQRLDLSGNKFVGPLPQQVGQLPNLRYLFFSSNAFWGSISIVMDSPSLICVDLSSNNLSGTLPDIDHLLHLACLNLSRNSLSGSLPTGFSKLQSLSLLDLSDNNFTGSLQVLNGSNTIKTLILSKNSFEDPLPELLSSRTVKLDHNLLHGPLQASFGSQLTELDLSSNSLTGPVLLRSWPLLHTLDLSSNKLTGSLPSNLTSLTSLRHLNLADNNFTDSSLPQLDGLLGLQFLNLSSAHVSGFIPESLGSLSNLTVIDLSNNGIRGTIPPSFSTLTSLTYLDLSRNALSGNVSQLSTLPSLRYLNLSYNSQLGCSSELLSKFGSDSFKGVSCQPMAAIIASSPRRSKSRVRLAVLIGVIAGASVLLCLILLIAAILCRRKGIWPAKKSPSRRNRFVSGPFSFESNSGPWVANVRNPNSVPVIMFEKPLLNLTFADLLRATSNFDKETQVSQGGLGPVYSAVLPGGLHVSIKVLIEGRVLTNQAAAAEFAVLSKIKHSNLVPLLGYCIVGEERLVIYQYMKNGGLHRWLLGSPESSLADASPSHPDVSRDLRARAEIEPLSAEANLTWPQRHNIALGIARALAFLHHGQSTKLVHRDVKASNVMLDEELEPHLANTGLAGLLAGSENAVFAGGSPGYAPPEYGQPGGQVSTSGDVFSYGVVLLELVTGKKPMGDSYNDCSRANNLVNWVRLVMHQKDREYALDPRACVDEQSQEQMLEVLRIGYLCTAELPSKRPTIQQVVGLLKDLQPHIMASP